MDPLFKTIDCQPYHFSVLKRTELIIKSFHTHCRIQYNTTTHITCIAPAAYCLYKKLIEFCLIIHLHFWSNETTNDEIFYFLPYTRK